MEHRGIRYDQDLTTHHEPLSLISEAFKMARTNIEFSSIDQKLRAIVVTSSNQSEGKSVTLANLAISYAQIGRKILLIDADLRRPSVHRLFGLPNRRGLTNALLNQGVYQDFVHETLTENLNILTAGPVPPNPAELLMSNTMTSLIDMAKTEYDLVMIDCAPVGAVTDAAIVSTKVDATLFVVRAGKVDKSQLKRASAMLKQINAKVLGYILNGVNDKTDDYYYYYYSQSYTAEANARQRGKKNTKPKQQKSFVNRNPQPAVATRLDNGKQQNSINREKEQARGNRTGESGQTANIIRKPPVNLKNESGGLRSEDD